MKFLPAITAGLALMLAPLTGHSSANDSVVRVQGVGVLSRILKAAAPELQKMGIEIKVAEECSSTQAIAAVGADAIDLALLGRAMTVDERAAYPDKDFHQVQMGAQTIAVLVSREIWESGVKALSQQQVADLYEGKVDSWKQLGGEERTPKFFEAAHGNGVWEIFATWLYGDMKKAPAVPWEVVKDGAAAQNAVQFRSGAVSVAPLRWADRREVFPLGIIAESGEVIEPTPVNVAARKYPLSRPAIVVSGDRPTGAKRKTMEFLSSEKGQALIAENDLLPLAALKQP